METITTSRTRTRNREAIVRDASELFLKAGFSGTSMAAVAAAVGGSKTTLYNHFPSKELLFEEVVHMALTSVMASVEEVDFRGLECRGALTAIATTIFSAAQSDVSIEVHRLVFFEARRDPSGARALLKRGPELGRRHLRSALEYFVANGELACSDIDKGATYFLSVLLYHHMLYREAGARPELTCAEIEKHVDTVVDDFLRISPVL